MLKSCVLVGLDWAEPMMFILLDVTCSCIFHAYVPFFLYINLCWYFSLSLSLSLSVSLLYGTQKEQVYSVSELSSFWDIYFWFYPFSHSVPWWEIPTRLLGELFLMRHLFRTHWIGLSPWCLYCCMSYVHAFFMNMYIFFILICVGTFLLLSLSLSLSLSQLVCSMAPKKSKSTPS